MEALLKLNHQTIKSYIEHLHVAQGTCCFFNEIQSFSHSFKLINRKKNVYPLFKEQSAWKF